jgi:hypothetical protein
MINSFVPIETPNGSEVTVKVTICAKSAIAQLAGRIAGRRSRSRIASIEACAHGDTVRRARPAARM